MEKFWRAIYIIVALIWANDFIMLLSGHIPSMVTIGLSLLICVVYFGILAIEGENSFEYRRGKQDGRLEALYEIKEESERRSSK